jgi:predicted dehydrogenase
MSFSARSYARIKGANDRLRVAVMGLNGRGMAHVSAFAAASNMQVTHLVDVDSKVLNTRGAEVAQKYGPTKLEPDYRRVLASRSVDILSVATPDHWHAKAALDAMSAGKHVYLEKPCGIAPSEGEALIAAQKSSGLVLQVGNQQRSSVETRELVSLGARRLVGRDLRRRHLVRQQQEIDRCGHRRRAATQSRLGPVARTPAAAHLSQ